MYSQIKTIQPLSAKAQKRQIQTIISNSTHRKRQITIRHQPMQPRELQQFLSKQTFWLSPKPVLSSQPKRTTATQPQPTELQLITTLQQQQRQQPTLRHHKRTS